MYRMITLGDVYFLSRPRRFGKSLLVSALNELFKGNKALFEGLYIYDKWDWTRQYPVIRIDWTIIQHSTPEELERDLSAYLGRIAEDFRLTLGREYASSRLNELIELLHRQTGEKVVVLVDEYDKPITSHLTDTGKIKAVREKLHNIYQVLKGSDNHLQFVFLTGVSKFAGLSIFSALNNLNDITLNAKYASICGYTQQELESHFAEYINDMVRETGATREDLLSAIKTWYNGYTWDGKTAVYNPYSTLMFFENREFANYWFRTGTPTFLMNLLIQKEYRLEQVLEPITVSSGVFDSYDPERLEEIPLLFQTGYLTIKKKEFVLMRPHYTLGLPNAEVGEALTEQLLNAYTAYPTGKAESLRERMQEQLRQQDTAGLEQCLREMLAGIPYLHVVRTEAWYHSVMLLWLRLLGFELLGEVPTNIGRIDAVWFFPGHAMVVEVKSRPEESDIARLLDAAIGQIREKRYYERFMGERQVSLLAVAFAGNEIGCRMEKV
jgi:hypothetical protein